MSCYLLVWFPDFFLYPVTVVALTILVSWAKSERPAAVVFSHSTAGYPAREKQWCHELPQIPAPRLEKYCYRLKNQTQEGGLTDVRVRFRHACCFHPPRWVLVTRRLNFLRFMCCACLLCLTLKVSYYARTFTTRLVFMLSLNVDIEVNVFVLKVNGWQIKKTLCRTFSHLKRQRDICVRLNSNLLT